MKNMFFISLITLFTTIIGCKKDDTTTPPPSNLNVSAVVATDSTGNVSFTATADNVTSYDYDFGNGVFQTVKDGKVTYRYQASGKYSVNVVAQNNDGQTISKSIQIDVMVNLKALWSDEFNIPGAPDPNKWNYDLGNGSGGWGNQELQYYTARPENVKVQNGVLKITALKEAYNGFNYTSARLKTQGKFAFKYGKVEVSAKLPTGAGTWPAAWMLGNNITNAGWPACGEIDIMEQKGYEPNKIYGTLHYPGFSGGNANGGTTTIANASTQFHKYSVDWSASAIRIYVDDKLFHTVINSQSLPFNQDFFMLLNLAMGGTFGGTVDAGFTNATLEIDYIRVYK